MQYNFEWDPQKAKANFKKHKVTFERAAEIFLDPFMLSVFDAKHSVTEDRWVTISKVMMMKREYDFSKGIRGKFYRPDVRLRLPVYLDEDVSQFVKEFAKRRKIDPQTAVNKLLRGNKEILQALHIEN